MVNRNIFRDLKNWLLAFLIAILICNPVVFIYYRPAGWIERTDAATDNIWRPNATLIMGLEGFGIYQVDKNGYLNENLPLEEEYILCVGNSNMQGKEVKKGNRISDILNNYYAESDEQLAVYNVSQDGFYFTDIVKSFPAIVGEFSNANTIIIEILKTDYTSLELQDAMVQKVYDAKQNGEIVWDNHSNIQKAKMSIKESFPILSLAKRQADVISGLKEDSFSEEKIANKEELYKTLKLMREQYDGRIIIVYHPTVSINEDGTCSMNIEDGTSLFKNTCEAIGIDFLDVSSAFQKAYEEENVVPYGFHNTMPGIGHLNEYGHKIIAEEIIKLISREEEQ